MDPILIGKFLAQLRRERGLTQEQLGLQLGVTNKTVSRWENGNYMPPVEMLQSLSQLYDVTINELLSGQRLSEAAYQKKAEENIKTALAASSFTLEERVAFYQHKWKKDHFQSRILVRLLLGSMLVISLWTHNLLWTAFYAVVGTSYYAMERNRMMTYVEARAFDGSGNP